MKNITRGTEYVALKGAKGIVDTVPAVASFVYDDVAGNIATMGKFGKFKSKLRDVIQNNKDLAVKYQSGVSIDEIKNDKRIPKELKEVDNYYWNRVLSPYMRELIGEQLNEEYSDLNPSFKYWAGDVVAENIGSMAGAGAISKGAKFATNAIGTTAKALKPATGIMRTLAPTATTLSMGLKSGGEKYNQLLDSGVEPNKALINALGTVYLTAITEKNGICGTTGH